jgi:hypothetical protein
VKLVLQAVHFTRQLFEFGVTDDAHLAVFERDGVAGMLFGADAVQTQNFACHLKSGNLLASILKEDVSLERTRPNGVNCLEGFAGAVKVVLSLDLASCADEFVQPIDLRFGHSEWQAQLQQITLGAQGLQVGYRDWHGGLHLHNDRAPFSDVSYA